MAKAKMKVSVHVIAALVGRHDCDMRLVAIDGSHIVVEVEGDAVPDGVEWVRSIRSQNTEFEKC